MKKDAKVYSIYYVETIDGKEIKIYSDKSIEELKQEVKDYNNILWKTDKHVELFETKYIKDIHI